MTHEGWIHLADEALRASGRGPCRKAVWLGGGWDVYDTPHAVSTASFHADAPAWVPAPHGEDPYSLPRAVARRNAEVA